MSVSSFKKCRAFYTKEALTFVGNSIDVSNKYSLVSLELLQQTFVAIRFADPKN